MGEPSDDLWPPALPVGDDMSKRAPWPRSTWKTTKWSWYTHPDYAWDGHGDGFAATPDAAVAQVREDFENQLALDRTGPFSLLPYEETPGGQVIVLIVNRRGEEIGSIQFEKADSGALSALAGFYAQGPAEANPRARDNFFWGKKEEKKPLLPVITFEEGLRRAQALGKGAPLGPGQYYLVKMPAPGGRPRTVWYFLSGLRPRAFEQAPIFIKPQSYITSLDPWRAVLSNLQAHGTPRDYSVLLLDTLVNKVGGVYDYARVAATVKAKENPYWVEVGEDGSPRQEQIWTGPGRSYWGDRQFSTADDHAVGEIIEMVEPFGVRSQYEVVEAASGKLSKQRGKVRRKWGAWRNPQALDNSWVKVLSSLAKNPVIQQIAVDITRRFSAKTWKRLQGMSVEERADWLQKNYLRASWGGGPAGRLLAKLITKLGKKRVALALSEAMMDPDVQQAAAEAGKLGGAVVQAQYGKEISAAKKKYLAAANPGVRQRKAWRNPHRTWAVVFKPTRATLSRAGSERYRVIGAETKREAEVKAEARWPGKVSRVVEASSHRRWQGAREEKLRRRGVIPMAVLVLAYRGRVSGGPLELDVVRSVFTAKPKQSPESFRRHLAAQLPAMREDLEASLSIPPQGKVFLYEFESAWPLQERPQALARSLISSGAPWTLVYQEDRTLEELIRDRQARRQARGNPWALVGRIALQLAIPIAQNVSQRTWKRLMAMSVEERADWIQATALKTSWLGGPFGRIMAGVGRRFGKGARRKVALWAAEAMTDPEVQQAALQAAEAGAAAYQAEKSKKIAANPKKARRRPALVIRVPVPFPVGQGVLSFMPEAARQARRAAKGPVEGYDREVHDISSSREIWSGPAKEIAVTFVSEENLCPLCGEPMAGEPAKEIAYRGTPGTREAHAECVDAEMKRWRLKLSP